MTPPVNIIENERRLTTHIRQRLHHRDRRQALRASYNDSLIPSSAVLFLMGMHRPTSGGQPEPCLIFNQRSRLVRQPGDLCFPGGGIMPRFDSALAGLLKLPGLTLTRWPHWSYWLDNDPVVARKMAVFLATSLRESFEEMGLNPLDITFLGPMPSERLVMFRRVIFPVVGWVGRQKRFRPNWEVDRIVYMPLRDFFNPGNYALFRLRYTGNPGETPDPGARDFLCFTPRSETGTPPLWGATFRIVLTFLEVVFGFQPPDMATLPVISGMLERDYTKKRS